MGNLLLEYVGADPGGTPPPDLTTVPHSGVSLVFALAFAVDSGGGNFQPLWDRSLTPRLISHVTQSTGACFVASLAGANSLWQDPSDVEGWISNATASLSNLISTYSLAGIDVDYEEGVDSTFTSAIVSVIGNLRAQHPQMWLSIAPFGRTWPVYQGIASSLGATAMTINYQAYGDGLTDQQSYLDLFASLAEFTGGYGDLLLGIASSTQAPRGLQPPEIYNVLSSLEADGIGGAAVWSAEHSAPSGFTIETNICPILADTLS